MKTARCTRFAAVAAVLMAMAAFSSRSDDAGSNAGATPTPAPQPTPSLGPPQTCATATNPDHITLKVFFLVYNPTAGPDFGNRKLLDVLGSPDVDSRLSSFVTDFVGAGGGAFCIDVERHDVDDLPPAMARRLEDPTGGLLIDNYHWVSVDAYIRNWQRYTSGARFVDLIGNGGADYETLLRDGRFGIVSLPGPLPGDRGER